MGNYRSFTSTPNTSLCLHLHFQLHLFNQRVRALLWRGRHHPSNWSPEALPLASLRDSSLVDIPPTQPSAFWRKTRTAVQQIPNPNPRRPYQHSVTTEEGETSTSTTTSTADTSDRVSSSLPDKSSGFSRRSSQEKPRQLSKASPWLKMSKASAETKPTHHILALTVSFSSFSSSLFLYLLSFPLFFLLLP